MALDKAARQWPDKRANPASFTSSSQDIHRTLPHSIEAEQGVLGSMLQSPDVIAECVEKINEAYFYIPSNQTIFLEIVRQWRSGQATDFITFTQVLRDKNLLEAVGGASMVTSLFTFVPTSANVTYYLEIIRDKHILRQIIAACTECVRRSFEEQDEIQALMDTVKDTIVRVGEDNFRPARGINAIVHDVLHNLSEPEKILGISTGFSKLDEVVGGFAEGAKVVLAAPTSGGKSAMAECFAESLAVTRGIPVAIFTFEMTAEEKAQRIIQIRSEVSFRKIAKQEAELFEMDAFSAAASEVARSPLSIIEDRLDIAGIRARCLQLKPRVAIIDYLQIVPEKRGRNESTTEKLDRMSEATKQIAHDLKITVIELSQITMDEKTGKGKTRYSSGITNDADQLWIIEGADDESKNAIEKQISVPKQRNGPRSVVPFTFVKNITKFRQKKN